MTVLADLNSLLSSPKTSHIVIYYDTANAVTALTDLTKDFAFNYSTNVLSVNDGGSWVAASADVTTSFVESTVYQQPPNSYYGIQINGYMDNSWPPAIGTGYLYVVPDWTTLLAIGSRTGEIAIVNDVMYMLATTPSAVKANWVTSVTLNSESVHPVLIDADLGTPLSGDLSNCFVPITKQLVKNGTGSTLTKGQAVYISGANGTNVIVSLAKADAELASSKTLGLIEADILTNGSGYVVTEGVLTGINTNAATNAGDPVWLSPTTAGGMVFGIANKPLAPYHLVYLGVVSRKNTNNGEIFIKVQNGYEIDELHDVSVATPADMDVLRFDSTAAIWKNKSLSINGKCTVAATAATGTVPVYVSTQTVLYYTTNASGNFVVNLTKSASGTITSAMSIGQVAEATFAVTNGSTAYYATSVQVDGSTSGVTTKWQGSVPSAGNINAVDVYTFKIIKTAASAFTVLASLSKFA